MMTRTLLALLLPVLAACSTGPEPDLGDPPPEPEIDWNPRWYDCVRFETPPEIDGRITDPCWQAAAWTRSFLDIRGAAAPEPRLVTRAKIGWDDAHLYVAAELEEPHVWATFTERDTVIYYDNDFEVFIDPDGDSHTYFELEINAHGTEWDLLLIRPYRDGGPAVHAWDIPGLRSGVSVRGTINRPEDQDQGWTVEIAFPFAALAECAGRPCPPEPGDVWRMNFSRVQWQTRVADGAYVKLKDPATGEDRPEDNWVWSPQGLVNMHYPEMWGFVRFVASGADVVPGVPSARDRAAWALRRVYYRQRAHAEEHGQFAPDALALGMRSTPVEDVPWPPKITATPHGFEASLKLDDGSYLRIDHEGRVR